MAKKIILVSDDVEETLELLKYSLEIAGYSVITAKNGEEALKQSQELRPDLIILDIVMPKIDGYTVNSKLKESEKTKDIPVVISTTRGLMSKMFSTDGKTKIDSFLEKPYTVEDLWSKVKEILEDGLWSKDK